MEVLEDRSLLSAIGVSIDGAQHQLVVFDPATGTQSGVVNIPNTDADTDVVVSPDGTKAYVAVFVERQIYVVDITSNSLATGINPIPTVTNPQDLAISSDGRFLLTVGASFATANTPIIVVDTVTRQVVENLNEGIGPSGIEVTNAGDVLVTSRGSGTTRRYTLDAAGQLTFTGQLTSNGGQNVTAAPNGITALQTNGATVTSLAISGMSQLDTLALPGTDFGDGAQSIAFSPDGSRFYVRMDSRVLGYNYNPLTGVIGSNFLTFTGLGNASGLNGVDQLDVTPDGSRVYVNSGSYIVAIDANDGSLREYFEVSGAGFVGLDISPEPVPATGPGTITGTKYNDLNGNGLREGGEPALAGWTVYVDLDNDSTRDGNEPFVTTDVDGKYAFTLDPGDYIIREEQQANWIQTAPRLSGTGGDRFFVVRGVSNQIPQIYELNLAGAVINSFAAPAAVNVIGTQGLAVGPSSLFYINGPGAGNFTLYELNPDTGAVIDSDVLPFNNEIAGLSYLNGKVYVESHPQNQLMVFDPASDTVVKTFTINADLFGGSTGAADLGLLFESNVSGQIFAINPSTGAVVYTLNPNVGQLAGGLAYRGGEIIAAPYANTSFAFRIHPTTGVVLGTVNLGGSGTVSGLGGDGVPGLPGPHLVTVVSGQTHGGRDFGNHSLLGTVTGTKYHDLDGDGVRDAGEPGLAGWIVYVDTDNDGTRDGNEPFATTGADGSYSLTATQGSYTLREEAQAGWVQTSPLPGLYATGNSGLSLTSINPATGTGAMIGAFGPNIVSTFAGAFTPDGTFWTIINSTSPSLARLATVNLSTGVPTPIGNVNWTGSAVWALESDAAGNLIGEDLNGSFYSVNKTTGQLSLLGRTGVNGITDLAFDMAGTLWGVAGTRLYRINPATGAAIQGPTITGTNADVRSIMVDPLTGIFYAATNTSGAQLYTIDLTTGAATGVGTNLGVNWLHGGDFMPLSANRGITINITSGQTLSGRDFGNELDQGVVTGLKFYDLDSDGVQDVNEPGLPGWVIYADADNDGIRDANEAFTTTTADGTYTLVAPSGNYTIREEPQAGWVQTSPQPPLFVTGEDGHVLFEVNPQTGTSNAVGSFGAFHHSTYAGAFTPDGTFWTIIDSFDPNLAQLGRVDLQTGVATPVGTPNWSGARLTALEADGAGNLIGIDWAGQYFSINTTTGELTLLGFAGVNGLKDLTFDNDGNLWGAANQELYRINPANGVSQPGLQIIGLEGQLQSIMVDPLSGIFYATTYSPNAKLYTIDVATGVATQVGSGLAINYANGGDFMPLSANRGYRVTVSAGHTLSGRNFGNEVDQGTVTGTKFNDLDGDGEQDPGEPGLADWVIYADLDNDSTHDANEPFTTTTATGAYSLTVASGAYVIREVPQSGWVQTSPQPQLFVTTTNGHELFEIHTDTATATRVGGFGVGIHSAYAGAFTPDGTFWTVIHAFDPELSQLAKVNLSSGAVTAVGSPVWSGAPLVALEADAAGNLLGAAYDGSFYRISTTTGELTLLGNTGFHFAKDLTFDNSGVLWGVAGSYLFRINPLNGAAVQGPQITGADGGEVQSIAVDPLTGTFYAATYSFGTTLLYSVDTTTGVATAMGSGLGYYQGSGGDFTPQSANRGHYVTVSAGHISSGRDFGNEVDLSTVSGTKFNDLDGDGTRDAGEPGLPGWVIYADLDNDGSRDANEPFTTTTATGSYSLSVPSGSYVIREESQAGWVQTSPRPELYVTGENGHELFEIDAASGTATRVGSFGVGLNFTHAGAFTPDGSFWTIINAFDLSTAQLAKVNLSTGAAIPVGNPIGSSSPIIALEADAAGNLLAVAFDGQFYSINTTTGELTLRGNTGLFGTKDLTFDNAGVLWGVTGSNLYRINPLNGAGTLGCAITGADAEVQSIMVDPLTGTFYAATYSFGTTLLYTVDTTSGVATAIGTGLGYRQGNGGDFTPQSANRGYQVTVAAGSTAAGRDFGNEADVSTISGTKFNDLDGDGTRDAGEPGLSGWVIYADLDNDGTRDAGEPFATTTSTGAYALTVPSGSYTLREEPKAGWNQTSPLPGLFTTANNGSLLATLDPATATGAVIGAFGAANELSFAGAFTPDGTFWTITNAFDPPLSQLAKVNLLTGELTHVGSPNWSGSTLMALEADSAGTLYGVNYAGSLFSVNKTTGELTLVGNTGVVGITELTFDNNGTLWGVSSNRLFQINLLTGASTIGPQISGDVDGSWPEIRGIMVDPLTGTFYAIGSTNRSTLYSVNVATGEATQVGPESAVPYATGGDFMPLSVNRGRVAGVSPGQSLAGQDFGNKLATPSPKAPKITGFDRITTYFENGIPLQIDNNTLVTNGDSANFGGGIFTATLITNQGTDDRLTIRNLAPTAGPVSVQGNQILYNGTLVATFTGGTTGFSPLVVTFEPGATNTIVRDVIRNLAFDSLSDAPFNAPRTVQIQLTDGHGGVSVPVITTVNVTPVNDKPVIDNFTGTVTYHENDPPVVIADAATVVDVDSANLDTGRLTVRVTVNVQSTDRLSIRNQGSTAGLIGTSGTNIVTYGGTPVGTYSGTTLLTVTLNAAATPAAVQALLRNVTFSRVAGVTLTNARTITVNLTDGDGGTSTTLTTTVNVENVNDAPVIGAFDTTVAYTENAAAALIDSNATVIDADQVDFATGVLIVDFTENGHDDDQVAIRNQGTAAGQIEIVDDKIRYGGVQIGTFTGGTSLANPLTVTFNSSALQVAVQAVVRNLTYRNISDDPTTARRTVRLRLTDGDGGSTEVTKWINVTKVNDAPVIGGFSGTAAYTEDAAPTVLSPTATIADLDSANFDTGRLTVRVLVNAQSTDRVSIRKEGTGPGQIDISGTSVLYGNLPIGTFASTSTLTVTFNPSANAQAVQAVLRNVTFHSTSQAPSDLTRTITAVLTDGDGGTSLTQTMTVAVTPVNDAPLITVPGNTVTYTEGGAAIVVASTITVSDPDSPNFNGGSLTVSLPVGVTPNDWLAIKDVGTGTGQIGLSGNVVNFGGIEIGTFTGGDAGTPLVVTFTSTAATPAAVQALMRSVTFRVAGSLTADSSRTVRFTLNDGDSVVTSQLEKLINVKNLP